MCLCENKMVHEQILFRFGATLNRAIFNDSLYEKHQNSLTVVDLVITGGDALGLFPKKLHEEP